MQESTPEKRKELKAYYKQSHDAFQACCDAGYDYRTKPEYIPLPDDLFDMRCGAKTKSTGKPCKRKDIYKNGRCKLHGGMSTGPRTIEGKRKAAMNGFKEIKS